MSLTKRAGSGSVPKCHGSATLLLRLQKTAQNIIKMYKLSCVIKCKHSWCKEGPEKTQKRFLIQIAVWLWPVFRL
jgi:hypothetical protein